VSGNVWSGGQLALSSGMRLSDALKEAGGIKPDTYLETVQISRLTSDSSRVMLRTSLSDTSGKPSDDIALQDADEIRVFSVTEFRPQRYVVVNGAVRRSGRLPYRDGMTLRDAVMLSGGTVEGALLNEAMIARMPDNRENGRTATNIRVSLDSTYIFERNGTGGRYLGPPGLPAPADRAPDVPLQPYDHVLILRQPGWSLPRSVAIVGEVRYPGRYTLESKSERLLDVIKQAGGLTPNAFANGIVFIRTRDIPPRRFVPRAVGPDTLQRQGYDTAAVLGRDTTGRIGIDLARVLKKPKHPDNVLLVDGDSIYIPVFEEVVHVIGAVNAPTAVPYVPGASVDYYVHAAGGSAARGDRKKAYVTQPNGKIESRYRSLGLFAAVPRPEPGSTVFVPIRVEEKRDIATVFATATSVVTSLATLILLLRK
jgi:protein involved in polysaccharide export with SLBB domain